MVRKQRKIRPANLNRNQMTSALTSSWNALSVKEMASKVFILRNLPGMMHFFKHHQQTDVRTRSTKGSGPGALQTQIKRERVAPSLSLVWTWRLKRQVDVSSELLVRLKSMSRCFPAAVFTTAKHRSICRKSASFSKWVRGKIKRSNIEEILSFGVVMLMHESPVSYGAFLLLDSDFIHSIQRISSGCDSFSFPCRLSPSCKHF